MCFCATSQHHTQQPPPHTGVGVWNQNSTERSLEKINFWSHPYGLVLAAPELLPIAICKKKKASQTFPPTFN